MVESLLDVGFLGVVLIPPGGAMDGLQSCVGEE